MSGVSEDVQDQLESALADESLTPQEKQAKIAYLRDQLLTRVGQAETYLNDAKLAEQASDIERYKALLHVRENADFRAELLRRGLATIEEVDAAGLLPHEELDRLGEEGLLQEFSLHAWRAELHPRDRSGRWSDVFKSVAPKGRHGKKQPSALHAPKEKGLRADVTPSELGIEPPPMPSEPHPDLAHKDAALLPHEQARAEAERVAGMSEEDRLAHYRSKSSEFDKRVQELASMRLATAFAKLGKKDPGTVVVHPEDVDKFLGSAPYGKVLYHGTPRSNIDSILSSGLRGGDTHMDIKGRETVFLTSSPDLAKGHGTPVPVATKLDRPLIVEPGEDANDAMRRAGVSNLDGFDGMVRKGADGSEIVTSWEPKDDLKVVTDEPVIDPRTLDKAELKFNAAGSVNQHTLGEFAREALGEPDTVDLHSTTAADGTRQYTPERKAIHDKIVSTFLRQKKQEEGKWVHCADCPELQGVDKPQVLFSGGGYSAGKGTVAKGLIKQIDSGYEGPPLVLDPDEIKAMLPEFRDRYEHDPLANAMVYREAWDIAQEIQRQVQERKVNIVVDGISDTSPEEMIQRVKGFTDKGYSAKAVYVDIPTDEALKRAQHRAETSTDKKDRRMIPTTIMRAVHRDVAATVPALARRVEKEGIPLDIEVHDNNQGKDEAGNFIAPKLFFSYDKKLGKSVVHDTKLWDAFRRKSREKLPEEKQALGESIYREAQHPRGRLGRWIDVLRSLSAEPKHDTGLGRREPVGWRRGRLETAGHTTGGRMLSKGPWTPVLTFPKPPGDPPNLFWSTREVLSRRDSHSPFEPSERAIARDLQQARTVGEQHLPEKGPLAQELLGDAKNTQEKYGIRFEGEHAVEYERDRAALHSQIVDVLLRQRKLDKKGKPTILDPTGEYLHPHPDADGKPVVVFMGGGSASGKGTVQELDSVRRGMFGEGEYVLIDADEIKAMLPEYHDMISHGDRYAALGVHDESSDIAHEVEMEAQRRGLNVIVDGTSDGLLYDKEGKLDNPNRLRNRFQAFRDKGYDIRVLYVNAPTDLAVIRATGRAFETGRWVPEPVIRGIHKGVSQRFRYEIIPAVQSGLIDRMIGYDTTGTLPVEVVRADGPGPIRVVDQARYDAFLAKEHE